VTARDPRIEETMAAVLLAIALLVALRLAGCA
jgi:hypothetical protein